MCVCEQKLTRIVKGRCWNIKNDLRYIVIIIIIIISATYIASAWSWCYNCFYYYYYSYHPIQITKLTIKLNVYINVGRYFSLLIWTNSFTAMFSYVRLLLHLWWNLVCNNWEWKRFPWILRRYGELYNTNYTILTFSEWYA